MFGPHEMKSKSFRNNVIFSTASGMTCGVWRFLVFQGMVFTAYFILASVTHITVPFIYLVLAGIAAAYTSRIVMDIRQQIVVSANLQKYIESETAIRLSKSKIPTQPSADKPKYPTDDWKPFIPEDDK